MPARKIFGKVIPHPFLISLEGLGGGQGRQAIYLASSNEDLHAIGLDWQGIVRSVSEMYFFGSIRKLTAILRPIPSQYYLKKQITLTALDEDLLE